MAPHAHAQSAGNDPMSGIHAGDVLVRLRAISIMPDVGTSNTLSALNVGVNNAIVPELDFTYMIRDDLGVELILGTSRHQLTSSLGRLGGVNVLPPTLLLQYHFNHAGRIRPYVGAGLNYTLFYNNGLSAGGESIGDQQSQLRARVAGRRRRAGHAQAVRQRGYQENLDAHGCDARRCSRLAA